MTTVDLECDSSGRTISMRRLTVWGGQKSGVGRKEEQS